MRRQPNPANAGVYDGARGLVGRSAEPTQWAVARKSPSSRETETPDTECSPQRQRAFGRLPRRAKCSASSPKGYTSTRGAVFFGVATAG